MRLGVEAVFAIQPTANESQSKRELRTVYLYRRNDKMPYRFQIELEREADGRWIAEIPRLPGVMVYGKTKHDAVRLVRALALRVLGTRP